MKTWVKVVLGIFGFLIIVGIFGSLSNPSETTYETGSAIKNEETPTKTSEPLTILNHEMTYGEYGNLIITGLAENTVGKQLSYTEIRVKFYDNEDVLIGTSLDNINDLDAGEKWRFEVMYLGLDDYDVDSYEIGVGSTW